MNRRKKIQQKLMKKQKKANAKKHTERYGSKKDIEPLSAPHSEPSQQSVKPS